MNTRKRLASVVPFAAVLLGLADSQPAVAETQIIETLPILSLTPAQQKQARIQVQPAGQAPLTTSGWTLQGQAIVPAQAQRMIAAPLSGMVQQVTIQPMQQVGAGQAVAVIHSPELLQWQRELAEASNELNLARQTLQREQTLYREGIIAEKRVIEARSAVQMAQLKIQEKRRLLALSGKRGSGQFDPVLTVRSQVSGQVVELLAHAGQRVEAGTPIASLVRADQLRIQLFASAAQAVQIQVGDSVQVAGCPQFGRVSTNNGWLDAKTQSRVIWVDMAGALTCLKPSQYLQAQVIPSPVNNRLMSLPAAAMVRQNNKPHVFVQHPQGFVPVPVHIKQRTGDQLQVLPFRVGGVRDLQVAVTGIAQLKAIWQGMGGEQMPPEPGTPAAGNMPAGSKGGN